MNESCPRQDEERGERAGDVRDAFVLRDRCVTKARRMLGGVKVGRRKCDTGMTRGVMGARILRD